MLKKVSYGLVLVAALFCAGSNGAQQYPVMDKVANKLIQKYQQASTYLQ